MTVKDILGKVEGIDKFQHLHEMNDLSVVYFDEIMELLEEYKEELLNKKIAK